MSSWSAFLEPSSLGDWPPGAWPVVLGLLTLIQEDAPTLVAAQMSAVGTIPFAAAFLGIFLGIWIGDILLYGFARGFGRRLFHHAWVRRFIDPRSVARSEAWFAGRGTWLLLSSRLVPGMRLPTYLAAGLLRLSFARFALTTGVAVSAWVGGIFILTGMLGGAPDTWLQRSKLGGWQTPLLLLGCLLALRLPARLLDHDRRRRTRDAFRRWTRWEFWPAWLFYLPVALNYLRLALRHRGLTVPTAANPGIFSGGLIGESKIQTLRDLEATSPEYTAPARRLDGTTVDARLASLRAARDELDLRYPFILKPDVGQRGVGVKLIRSPEQAWDCLNATSAPFLVQRYAPGPFEVGVFYYRHPGEPYGRIFALTEKVFPTVTGDGQHTLEELVQHDARARLLTGLYLTRLEARRPEVIAAGEVVKLVEAGNHAQGCIFRDGSHLWSEVLEQRVDDISQRLKGFYVGRFDIRYASADDLRAGLNFQIVELNGAASEATNIYDPRNSLRSAYRTLFRQWEIVFEIGAFNRHLGTQPLGLSELWSAWRETRSRIATYPAAD